MTSKTSYTLCSSSSLKNSQNLRSVSLDSNLTKKLYLAQQKLLNIIDDLMKTAKGSSTDKQLHKPFYLTVEQYQDAIWASKVLKNTEEILNKKNRRRLKTVFNANHIDLENENVKINKFGQIYIDTSILVQLIELKNLLGEAINKTQDIANASSSDSFDPEEKYDDKTNTSGDDSNMFVNLQKKDPGEYCKIKISSPKDNGSKKLPYTESDKRNKHEKGNDEQLTYPLEGTFTVMSTHGIRNPKEGTRCGCPPRKISFCPLSEVQTSTSELRVGGSKPASLRKVRSTGDQANEGKKVTDVNGARDIIVKCISDLDKIRTFFETNMVDVGVTAEFQIQNLGVSRSVGPATSMPTSKQSVPPSQCSCGQTGRGTNSKIIICIKGKQDTEGDVHIIIRKCSECKSESPGNATETLKRKSESKIICKTPSNAPCDPCNPDPLPCEPCNRPCNIPFGISCDVSAGVSPSLLSIQANKSGLNLIFNPDNPGKSVVEPYKDIYADTATSANFISDESSQEHFERIKMYDTTNLCVATEDGQELVISVIVKPRAGKQGRNILKDIFSDSTTGVNRQPCRGNRNAAVHRMIPDRVIPLKRTKVCSSLEFDVSVMDTRMRDKGIKHLNQSIVVRLQELGVNNLLRACRPVKCGRKAVLNETLRKCLPYSASLTSLPLEETDADIIDQSLNMSLKKTRHLKDRMNKMSYFTRITNKETYKNTVQISFLQILHPKVMFPKVTGTKTKYVLKKLSFYINLVHDVENTYKKRVYEVRIFEVKRYHNGALHNTTNPLQSNTIHSKPAPGFSGEFKSPANSKRISKKKTGQAKISAENTDSCSTINSITKQSFKYHPNKQSVSNNSRQLECTKRPPVNSTQNIRSEERKKYVSRIPVYKYIKQKNISYEESIEGQSDVDNISSQSSREEKNRTGGTEENTENLSAKGSNRLPQMVVWQPETDQVTATENKVSEKPDDDLPETENMDLCEPDNNLITVENFVPWEPVSDLIEIENTGSWEPDNDLMEVENTASWEPANDLIETETIVSWKPDTDFITENPQILNYDLVPRSVKGGDKRITGIDNFTEMSTDPKSSEDSFELYFNNYFYDTYFSKPTLYNKQSSLRMVKQRRKKSEFLSTRSRSEIFIDGSKRNIGYINIATDQIRNNQSFQINRNDTLSKIKLKQFFDGDLKISKSGMQYATKIFVEYLLKDACLRDNKDTIVKDKDSVSSCKESFQNKCFEKIVNIVKQRIVEDTKKTLRLSSQPNVEAGIDASDVSVQIQVTRIKSISQRINGEHLLTSYFNNKINRHTFLSSADTNEHSVQTVLHHGISKCCQMPDKKVAEMESQVDAYTDLPTITCPSCDHFDTFIVKFESTTSTSLLSKDLSSYDVIDDTIKYPLRNECSFSRLRSLLDTDYKFMKQIVENQWQCMGREPIEYFVYQNCNCMKSETFMEKLREKSKSCFKSCKDRVIVKYKNNKCFKRSYEDCSVLICKNCGCYISPSPPKKKLDLTNYCSCIRPSAEYRQSLSSQCKPNPNYCKQCPNQYKPCLRQYKQSQSPYRQSPNHYEDYEPSDYFDATEISSGDRDSPLFEKTKEPEEDIEKSFKENKSFMITSSSEALNATHGHEKMGKQREIKDVPGDHSGKHEKVYKEKYTSLEESLSSRILDATHPYEDTDKSEKSMKSNKYSTREHTEYPPKLCACCMAYDSGRPAGCRYTKHKGSCKTRLKHHFDKCNTSLKRLPCLSTKRVGNEFCLCRDTKNVGVRCFPNSVNVGVCTHLNAPKIQNTSCAHCVGKQDKSVDTKPSCKDLGLQCLCPIPEQDNSVCNTSTCDELSAAQNEEREAFHSSNVSHKSGTDNTGFHSTIDDDLDDFLETSTDKSSNKTQNKTLDTTSGITQSSSGDIAENKPVADSADKIDDKS